MNRGSPARSWYRPALLACGAGVLLGVIVGGRHETVEPAPNAVPVHETTRTTAPVENRSMAKATPASTPAAEPAPLPPDYLGRLKALSDLNDDLRSKIYFRMLNEKGLNEDFVRLFGLSPGETQRLDDAVTQTCRKLKELEARTATISKSGNGEFIVTIPEAPVEGGIIYDELMQAIRETLGPQRLIYAERLSSFGFENSTLFDRFGLRRAEIHLKPLQDEQGQPTQRWSTEWHPSNDIMVQTIIMDPDLLENTFPLIHQKMLDGGFLVAKP